MCEGWLETLLTWISSAHWYLHRPGWAFQGDWRKSSPYIHPTTLPPPSHSSVYVQRIFSVIKHCKERWVGWPTGHFLPLFVMAELMKRKRGLCQHLAISQTHQCVSADLKLLIPKSEKTKLDFPACWGLLPLEWAMTPRVLEEGCLAIREACKCVQRESRAQRAAAPRTARSAWVHKLGVNSSELPTRD